MYELLTTVCIQASFVYFVSTKLNIYCKVPKLDGIMSHVYIYIAGQIYNPNGCQVLDK